MRLPVVIRNPLFNPAIVQAASKQTLSNGSLLSNVRTRWGEKMRCGLCSKGVPMSQEQLSVGEKDRDFVLQINLSVYSRAVTLEGKSIYPKLRVLLWCSPLLKGSRCNLGVDMPEARV